MGCPNKMEDFFDCLHKDDYFLREIEPNIWLMDNHKWAFYVWESMARAQNGDLKLELIHVDYHFDDIDDIGGNTEIEGQLKLATLSDIYEWTCREDRPIIYDSFISPAIRIGRLKTIHWLCRQSREDHGFGSFLDQFGCTELYYANVDELAEAGVFQPFIFDLDLDFLMTMNLIQKMGQYGQKVMLKILSSDAPTSLLEPKLLLLPCLLNIVGQMKILEHSQE